MAKQIVIKLLQTGFLSFKEQLSDTHSHIDEAMHFGTISKMNETLKFASVFVYFFFVCVCLTPISVHKIAIILQIICYDL